MWCMNPTDLVLQPQKVMKVVQKAILSTDVKFIAFLFITFEEKIMTAENLRPFIIFKNRKT